VIKRTALIAVPIVALAYVYWLDWKHGAAYEEVLVGSTTEAVVRELAGTPSYVTDGTRWVEPKYVKAADQLGPGCVKELWAAKPWPMPQRLSFCFDRDGVLLHKYNWESW
jgi:hypothetical protein